MRQRRIVTLGEHAGLLDLTSSHAYFLDRHKRPAGNHPRHFAASCPKSPEANLGGQPGDNTRRQRGDLTCQSDGGTYSSWHTYFFRPERYQPKP